MMVTSTDGRKTASDSHRAEPFLRRPIITPLNMGPRYNAEVRTRAVAGSCHVPPFLAIASWWMVSTTDCKEVSRGAPGRPWTLNRMSTTTAKPITVHAAMSQPSSGGSRSACGAAASAGRRLPASHAPRNTAAHAAARNSMPTGAMLIGLAMRGRPPKTHQNPAKKAAGAYQLPPVLRAAHAIAGRSRNMAAVSQLISRLGRQPLQAQKKLRARYRDACLRKRDVSRFHRPDAVLRSVCSITIDG